MQKRRTLFISSLSSCNLSTSVPAAVRQSRNTTALGPGRHSDWSRSTCTYPSLHMHTRKGIPALQRPVQTVSLLASSIEHDPVRTAATPSRVQLHTTHLCLVPFFLQCILAAFPILILSREDKDVVAQASKAISISTLIQNKPIRWRTRPITAGHVERQQSRYRGLEGAASHRRSLHPERVSWGGRSSRDW